MENKNLRPFELSEKEENNIEFLFVTPFANGCLGPLNGMPENSSKRLIIGINEAENKIKYLIENKKLKVRNILFNNAIIYSKNFINYCFSMNIKISSFELGWFPHYRVWHCDPCGFSSNSMLSKSRLDDIEIDIEYINHLLQIYKNKWAKIENTFDIKNNYILLIMQHDKDATILHDAPFFTNWQDIINFSERVKQNKNQIIVIKVNPQNVASQTKILLPHNSIAIQSKKFNNYLLAHADMVIGINSTMLYEASLLYDKPVLALGNSWFDSHPEIVKKVNINDEKIDEPIVSKNDILYRRKMFYIMTKMQTPIIPKNLNKMSAHVLCQKHFQASSVKNIKDWLYNCDKNYEWKP